LRDRLVDVAGLEQRVREHAPKLGVLGGDPDCLGQGFGAGIVGHVVSIGLVGGVRAGLPPTIAGRDRSCR
jgi:hypothetical protein